MDQTHLGRDFMSDDELLTVKEVAERVKVHPETVRGWIRDGELEAVDIGGEYRIYKQDLDTFLKERKRPKKA